MIRGASIPLLVAALALLSPGVARADDAAAARSFRAGAAAYDRGDFYNAAVAFEEAHRQSPRGAAMYNAGLAWAFAKTDARAADAFRVALSEGGLSQAQQKDARARLDAYEKRLGEVDVRAPKGSLVVVGPGAPAPAPVVAHAAPGDVVVRAELPDGEKVTRVVSVHAGAIALVDFSGPSPTSARGAAPPPPLTTGPSSVTWLVAGVSVAAAGVAIATGAAALGARDAFDASGHTDASARERAGGYRTAANVMWVSAGVFAAGSVVLFFATRGARRASTPATRAAGWSASGAVPTVRF